MVATQVNLDKETFYVKESSITYPEYSEKTTCLCLNGKVISAVVMKDNTFCLFQMGPLDFAVEYSSAVTNIYDAIGYIPPRGDREERLRKRLISFQESIEKGKKSIQFFKGMQLEAEHKNPGRSSFHGADGMPFTGTIESLESTVQSWEVLQKRCNMIKEDSSCNIYPPAVTSEKNIEHGFGYVSKKGQGHNLSMEEYIIAKRRSTVDFQLRMSKMPFCQRVKDSVQDKGYQDIDGGSCKISVKDLKEIFEFSKKESYTKSTSRRSQADIPEEDKIMIKKAYLLSKCVPRQTNRSKWREKSGYQPNMLSEKEFPGMLIANDLVCCRSVSDTLMYLIVREDVLLKDDDVKIPVRFPGGTVGFEISSDKLVVENGQIMVLPSSLYHENDEDVILSDVVAGDFQSLSENQVKDLTEEEWAILVDVSGVHDEADGKEKGRGKRKACEEKDKRKKRKI